MDREGDRVARRLDQRHVGGHHVTRNGLAQVLKQLAAVRGDAGPLARELVHAHVGDALVDNLGQRVAQRAARGQAQQQVALGGADLQAQRGVRRAPRVEGLHDHVLEPAPVPGDVGVRLAPCALERVAGHKGVVGQPVARLAILDDPRQVVVGLVHQLLGRQRQDLLG